MSEEITCPDCGGLIGATPGQGRQVCKCFEPKKAATIAPALDEALDDSGSGQGSSVARHDIASGEKICHACGKDVSGHRRFKDSRGYMCKACHEMEQLSNETHDLIPCPECGRKLKVEGITTYNGQVMCKRCAGEQRELNKYKPLAPGLLKHDEEEKKSFRNLLIVAGVLLLFVLIATIKLIAHYA